MQSNLRASKPKPNAQVVLNIVLLSALALLVLVPNAGAQLNSGQSNRARGDYTLVGGDTSSGNANAIYILDTSNRELVAVRWNQSTKKLEGLGYRDLSRDLFAQSDR